MQIRRSAVGTGDNYVNISIWTFINTLDLQGAKAQIGMFLKNSKS